ncbi:hypothetical protein EV702DRAFT_519668 [Suillus placidus]|uniref:CFEM domain-containing protein n=1 Tax=Suillus placidus TaxID=48579 RepID=A0A9P6ZQ40_9AGAM|nr:hypothetical protein EV702DRAFT_519668 [Suillus placidus]
MLFKSLFVLAAAALAANAQAVTTTSDAAAATPSGVTECIVSCSTQAAAAGGCSSYTDLSCVCTSTAFQTAASACLQANCTAAELAEALSLQKTECAAFSGNSTTTTSTGGTPSASIKTSSATTSPAKTSGATASGAATGLVPSLALNSAFGGLVALAGTLIGAALVM